MGSALEASGTGPTGGTVIASSRDHSKSAPLSLADRIEQVDHALTADELANILAVSRITIFKQAKAGRIPSFRIGTCVRFDPRAIANWLRTQ